MKKQIPFTYILKFFTIGAFCILISSCSKSNNKAAQLIENTNASEKPSEFTTEITSLSPRDVNGTSAVLIGKVVHTTDGIIYGFCWDEREFPTIENQIIEASTIFGNGEFQGLLQGLEYDTDYHVRAYAKVGDEIVYGDEIIFRTLPAQETEIDQTVWTDEASFESYEVFEEKWNYLYPWGPDHNGSARMYASTEDHSQVSLEEGILKIKADRISDYEGESTADPHLKINYHSGAVHLKKQIIVNDETPYWSISGDFQVPYERGCWPAFWITGAWTWPPESDIMEFKGTNTCWQNTAEGPDWTQVSWQNNLPVIEHPEEWHTYKVVLQKATDTEVSLTYYVDDEATGTHSAEFVGKPFWLIINLQMEGDSGDPGPEEAVMKAKNIKVISRP